MPHALWERTCMPLLCCVTPSQAAVSCVTVKSYKLLATLREKGHALGGVGWMLYTCREVTGSSLLRLSATAEASTSWTTWCELAPFVHPATRYVDATLFLCFSANSNRCLFASLAGTEKCLASHLYEMACRHRLWIREMHCLRTA